MDNFKYNLKGGGRIEAATNFGLIESLREQSFSPATTQKQFMQEMAERCLTQTGHNIRTDNPVVFIESLVYAGYLTPV